MKNKINRRTFAIQSGASILGLSALNVFASVSAKSSSPLSKEFLEELPKMMELANVPGVAAAVVENGKLSWSGEFGVKNAETKEPVTSETVFPVGSLGKPVFAYTALLLKDEGLLDLDRPLIDYLPIDYVPNEPRAKTITARQVLSHSSGLQNWRFQTNQQLQLAFNPGERFSYSGEGIYYLQRIVEKITGKGFEQFMREKVFEPFGMKHSSYFWLPEYEKNLVTSHNREGQVAQYLSTPQIPKMLELATKWNKPVETWTYEDVERAFPLVETRVPALPTFFSINAAGTLQLTVKDYAQILIRMLDKSSRDKFSLKDETLKEMLTTKSKINSALSWGLGIGLETNKDGSYFWHWGEGVNYRTFVIGNRTKKWGIIVFTNARNGQRICERIITAAAKKDFASFLWV
ncbi:MAG: beta-lactamase family protein [Pyrinomonadaceae bacterium]|nr:beta-lactamase family protein [Pyrinomonadaceae bacterium]